MAYGLFSLLLTRRFCLSSLNPKCSFLLSHFVTTNSTSSKPFSTSPDPASNSNPKPSSLSARLSFVFDRIDAIEKERSQKHETLQRIRAWRESKKTPSPQDDAHRPESGSPLAYDVDPRPDDAPLDESKVEVKKEVEVVHPWPEWIQLMERLVHQNYFDHRRRDEDKMVQDLGFDPLEVADDVGFDFTKDFRSVQTACLNLGKDRFDVLRSLSRQDIQILVGFGCPTVDKKVVFSAKLLRKHAHLDEGDVCSSCSLRSTCERAYLLTNKEDEARTIDVMRILLTFGFNPVNGSVINQSLLKQKSVKTVVRKLLHEVVKLTSVPIDPNLSPPVIKKPPPKVKQPPPSPKKRVGRDDVEMKKGDWLCPKCDFLNFAKNTICLQCDAKRPKRQLLPGEWECPECNFLNYRRNMVCFHCECKRPPDEFLENKMQDKIQSLKARSDIRGSRPEVSNAWNFDFDDDESDGADVAAFEYADAHAIDEDFPSGSQAQHGNFRMLDDDFDKNKTVQRSHGGEYPNLASRPRVGFDDFDDEDDIDSYELETQTQNNSTRMGASKSHFSEIEDSMGLEDTEDTEKLHARHKMASRRSVQSHPIHKNTSFSGSEDDELDFDSDEQLSIQSNFKSNHISAAGQKRKGRGPANKLSFGSESDKDFGGGLYSDEDDDLNEAYPSRKNRGDKHYPSRQMNGKRHDSGRWNITRDRKSGSTGGHKANMFRDDGSSQQSHSKGKNDRNWKKFEDFDGSFRQSYGNGRQSRGNDRIGSSRQSYGNGGRGSRGNDRNWQRFEDTERGIGQFKRSRRELFEKSQKGDFNKYHAGEEDFGEFRNSRRVIER